MKYIQIVPVIMAMLFSSQSLAAHHEASPAVPVEFWSCKLVDGKTMDDLMGWYEKFSKHASKMSEESYTAWVMTPFLTSNLKEVDFVAAGSWANLSAMGAGFNEFFNDKKGTELFAEYQSIADCFSHTVWNSTMVHKGKSNP